MIADIRVLVVEDELLSAQAHAEYVRRTDGFELAEVVHTGAKALSALGAQQQLKGQPAKGQSAAGQPAKGQSAAGQSTKGQSAAGGPIDLVLLDMNLPDLHGLDVCRRMRAAGLSTDVIAITAVRELPIVRGAISAGIIQYLIKPFAYSAFAEKLNNYRDFRMNLDLQATATTQSEVDKALASLRSPGTSALPKGLSAETLAAVVGMLQEAASPVSALEVMQALGISRVTARRYLEYLAQERSVVKQQRYGTPGRPEYQYRWSR